MVKMALAGHKRFKVSTMELRRRGISYTVDTLNHSGGVFRMLLCTDHCADNLKQFQSWKSPKAIILRLGVSYSV